MSGPKKLPAAANSQLPVVAKAVRPLRALNQFADRADSLSRFHERVGKRRELLETVCRYPWDADAQKCLDQASAALDEYDRRFRELAKDLQANLAKFNPDDAYDDDCQLTEERVVKHIGLLLSSFPNAAPGNPEAYLGMMVEEVMTLDISLPVLESACSQIRKASKFAPSISEVIEATEEQDELWSPRLSAIDSCADCVEYLRDELKAATEMVAAEQAKREEERRAAAEKKRIDDELRAKPLVVGDRVRACGEYSGYGPGTIERESWAGFIVMLDTACQYVFKPAGLARLIPGDANFELSDAKRAEITQKLVEYDQRIAGRKAAYEHRRAEQVLESDDRVWNEHWGYGTVMDVSDCPDSYSVRFDSGYVRSMYRDYLELRLAGLDDWGEAPLNVSMDFPVDPGDDEEDDPPRSYFGGALPPPAETSKPDSPPPDEDEEFSFG
jgi:hypothetical protein